MPAAGTLPENDGNIDIWKTLEDAKKRQGEIRVRMKRKSTYGNVGESAELVSHSSGDEEYEYEYDDEKDNNKSPEVVTAKSPVSKPPIQSWIDRGESNASSGVSSGLPKMDSTFDSSINTQSDNDDDKGMDSEESDSHDSTDPYFHHFKRYVAKQERLSSGSSTPAKSLAAKSRKSSDASDIMSPEEALETVLNNAEIMAACQAQEQPSVQPFDDNNNNNSSSSSSITNKQQPSPIDIHGCGGNQLGQQEQEEEEEQPQQSQDRTEQPRLSQKEREEAEFGYQHNHQQQPRYEEGEEGAYQEQLLPRLVPFEFDDGTFEEEEDNGDPNKEFGAGGDSEPQKDDRNRTPDETMAYVKQKLQNMLEDVENDDSSYGETTKTQIQNALFALQNNKAITRIDEVMDESSLSSAATDEFYDARDALTDSMRALNTSTRTMHSTKSNKSGRSSQRSQKSQKSLQSPRFQQSNEDNIADGKAGGWTNFAYSTWRSSMSMFSHDPDPTLLKDNTTKAREQGVESMEAETSLFSSLRLSLFGKDESNPNQGVFQNNHTNLAIKTNQPLSRELDVIRKCLEHQKIREQEEAKKRKDAANLDVDNLRLQRQEERQRQMVANEVERYRQIMIGMGKGDKLAKLGREAADEYDDRIAMEGAMREQELKAQRMKRFDRGGARYGDESDSDSGSEYTYEEQECCCFVFEIRRKY